MRIWSLNSKYLDTKGLLALWRETLLAQKVLAGNTKGYKNHPQLNRFKSTSDPVGAVSAYLSFVAQEADRRGYNFDKSKIFEFSFDQKIKVTSGQVDFEFRHLLKKLEKRDSDLYQKYKEIKNIELHPLFVLIDGGIEDWEII